MTLRRLSLALAVLVLPLSGAAGQQREAGPLPTPRPTAVEPLSAPSGVAQPQSLPVEPSCGCDRCASCTPAVGSPVPPGFTDELVIDSWNQAVGVAFAPDGRGYVWQRNGRIYVVENGVKLNHAALDIGGEVANWGDHGLIGVALDPQFYSNGYIYLLYVVDYHHLTKFGTLEYSPTTNEYNQDTIGRITRYTATAAGGFKSFNPASRLVLVGESKSTGIPISGSSHGVGGLVFGEDGTLLASCGDGNAGDGSGTLLSDEIIQLKENVSSFRCQLVDSLSGKVLRIDPATGDGVPGNPFYDHSAPRAPRSRVWTLGLRNPARLTLRPGSGNPSPLADDPGTLCIGDVGAEFSEELSLASTGGLNLGWPLYEGLQPNPFWMSQNYFNTDAPNPLFEPGDGGPCPAPFLTFQQLLLQDSLNPPLWPNPCDPRVGLVTPAPLFVHRRPVIEWLHAGPARVPIYDAGGAADVAVMGTPQSPVAGSNFLGNCSIGGAWSTGVGFPEPWQNGYFHGDYGVGWIRFARFDAAGTLLSSESFADPVGRIVYLAWDDATGSLWYINYTDTGIGELHRIHWAEGNQPPLASAQPVTSFGPAPRTVAFDGTASSDPEAGPLQFSWDFGDGTPPSLLPKPVHTFPSEDITASGTIIGKVFELTPPGSTVLLSNPDPEVMRDGDYPPEGSADDQRQYDTMHFVDGVSDKGGICWMGYAFPTERSFVGMHYEEGLTYGGGGWFDTWSVEVRQAGVWVPVEEVVADPPYPPVEGTPHFQTFEFRFPPATGDAIRIYGAPGGVGDYDFITIGELRVLAEPATPLTEAMNVAITLTVTDNAGAEDQAGATVSLNNTPPVPVIVSPADLGTYPAEVSLIDLAQLSYDDQPGPLSCTWQVILHHNTHNHPGPLLETCVPLPQAVTPEGCGDGAVYYNEIRLTVTDALGLSASTAHYLFPECDRNLNGADDALDIAGRVSQDHDHDGIPDEAQTDCNHNGKPDLYEIFLGWLRDVNVNGVPDQCEPPLIEDTQPLDSVAPLPPPF